MPSISITIYCIHSHASCILSCIFYGSRCHVNVWHSSAWRITGIIYGTGVILCMLGSAKVLIISAATIFVTMQDVQETGLNDFFSHL
jgi:hypothetical protein